MGRCSAMLLFAAVAFAGSGGLLPEGEGKKIVEGACASCHGLEVVGGKQWSKPRWEAVVAAMVDRGAQLKKGEAPVVVEYLAKNFGEDRGKALVEDVCSQCHEWQRVKDRELTKEEWAGLVKGMIFEGSP